MESGGPSKTETLTTRCCVAGGGPAGMMAAFLLARAGVDVVLLEKHADFFRDFRGDTIHPSTLEIMDELGLYDEFLKLPHQETRLLKAQVGATELPMADFSHLPSRAKFLAFMPQWDFLDFLAGQAKCYPAFRLEMHAEVVGLIHEGDRVAGAKVKTAQGRLEVRADLTIGADGRSSLVRREAGLSPKELGAPMDVCWFRLSWADGDPEETFGRVDSGQILVLINRGSYWQCGYVIPKGTAGELKAQGIAALRQRIEALAPFLAGCAAELKSFDDINLLTVAIDRLPLWHKPGRFALATPPMPCHPSAASGSILQSRMRLPPPIFWPSLCRALGRWQTNAWRKSKSAANGQPRSFRACKLPFRTGSFRVSSPVREKYRRPGFCGSSFAFRLCGGFRRR